MKVYYDQDADINALKGKTVAIIGYGSQGHAHAQNLRDSGVNVVVGQRPGGANYELAREHGFSPVSAAEAAAQADLIMILLPDEVQAAVYENDIKPHLTKGKALLFAHGFNIHFNQIIPPKDVDVFLIAPKGPGHLVRRTFTEGGGVPCLVAIEQNATGEALQIALAYAKGIGGTRSGGETVRLQAVSVPDAEKSADSSAYTTAWRLEGDPDAALDEEKTDALLSALSGYVTGQITAAAGADPSACGFDQPLVTLSASDGEKDYALTYAAGADGYYLMVKGDSSIYTVDGTVLDAFVLAEELKT